MSGSAPNRIFNIEWRATYFEGGADVNFEIRLHENQPTFDLIYGVVSDSGGSATIGVQANSANFTQFRCNTAALRLGLQVTFNPPLCGATATPTSTRTRLPSATATQTRTGVPTITAIATTTSIPFIDVNPLDYFYTTVQYLAARRIISGYDNGNGSFSFRPYNNTTRGQMVKIVGGAFAVPAYTPPAGGQTFRDVPPTHPFFAAIEAANHAGIVSGYANVDGTFSFRPGADVTRGQLSKIVVTAAHWPTIHPTTARFTDVPVGSTFYDFIETAVCHGVVSGYDDSNGAFSFRPGSNAIRGQIAKIVYNALTNTSTTCGSPQK